MKENKEKRFVIRLIDANLNRSREGLRVCEDMARFYLNNREIIEDLKSLRHSISKAMSLLPFEIKDLFRDRDIKSDMGRKIKPEIVNKSSEKIFFNADIRKSNADKRRFVVGNICENPRAICENLRSRKVFQGTNKKTILNIFFANMQRAKESLRVLEECSKLFDYKLSEVFRRLRFKTYEIEKETAKRLFSLCSIG